MNGALGMKSLVKMIGHWDFKFNSYLYLQGTYMFSLQKG